MGFGFLILSKVRKNILLADVVLHRLVGQDHRQLDEAGVLAVLVPGDLVDELFLTLLVDGVDVLELLGHHLPEERASRLGVAVEDVEADEIAPVGAIDLARLLIHLDDLPLLVANGDGYIRLVKVLEHNSGD